ncbi:MAG: hypothetical protein M2R45_03227 [Verrucomicrobia subdivision 3 bacterium]|nr:hypothetical protein [Limisphaerales bacterium]MCS1416088.1 hypothetical protein [Limisphaerales bacterium]
MVTDGGRTKVLRKRIDPNDFEYVADLPAYGKESPAQVQLTRMVPETGDQRRTGLKKIDSSYERLLADCHSTLRDVDGLHADETLDELCKIIYAKIFDERLTTQKAQGVAFRFQTYGAANASEAASDIRTLYEDAREYGIEIYSKRIPEYERSRGILKQ